VINDAANKDVLGHFAVSEGISISKSLTSPYMPCSLELSFHVLKMIEDGVGVGREG
jgi:hypothetical protein